jgi:signal transduction histidine kinase
MARWAWTSELMATEIETASRELATLPRSRFFGLSARLLLLTAAFVMLAEVLIYVPSVADFRRNWLADRIAGAQMVLMVLDATAGPPSEAARARVLAAVKARAITVRGEGTRWLLADGERAPEVGRRVDLRDPPWHVLIIDALRTLAAPSDKPIQVTGPGMGHIGWVELILDERPLRAAMLDYSRNILLVSLIISIISAGLVYLALHLIIVRPVLRLAANISDFGRDPEDSARIIVPSAREDEIGLAERALARMESALAGELRQKRRLAELGLAVSKINHELRNMLTTAQLLSDRLRGLDDPAVAGVAPRLMATLARAIAFCEATLAHGRAQEAAPRRRRLPLAPLVAEVVDSAGLAGGGIRFAVAVPENLEIDADPEQLARVLTNVVRNAVQALAAAPEGTPPEIGIAAERRGATVLVRVADNGPGVPAPARRRLFSAFQGSARSGSTGLGLAIADELVRLHGGRITLEDTAIGASFRIEIPDRT